MATKFMIQSCYLHAGQPATLALNIPCAPGGKIHVCAKCAARNRDEMAREVWEKYKVEHEQAIRGFKAPANPNN